MDPKSTLWVQVEPKQLHTYKGRAWDQPFMLGNFKPEKCEVDICVLYYEMESPM